MEGDVEVAALGRHFNFVSWVCRSVGEGGAIRLLDAWLVVSGEVCGMVSEESRYWACMGSAVL